MNTILDSVLVATLLLASCCYALLRLGPRSFRQRIYRFLSLIFAAAPSFLRVSGVAQRLAAAAGKTPAACGGCESCGTESASAPQPSEINVPIGKIGRRT